MDWTFGKIFTQAFQNAMQSEQQRKKDAQNYNLAVDQLNLDKWRTYNDLNMRGMDLNTRNQQFDVTRQDNINRFNTEMIYDAAKTNREYDYKYATEGFVPDQNFAKGYQDVYGTPYQGTIGQWVPFKYTDQYNKWGEVWKTAQENEKNRAHETFLTNLREAGANTRTAMQLKHDRDMADLGYTQKDKEYWRGLDTTAQNMSLYKVNARGDGLDTTSRKRPNSWSDYLQLQQQGYYTVEEWNAVNSSTVFNGTKTSKDYGSGWNPPITSAPFYPYNIDGTK